MDLDTDLDIDFDIDPDFDRRSKHRLVIQVDGSILEFLKFNLISSLMIRE